jgi:hypothetical protein
LLYICVFMTCSTSYCLCDTLMDTKRHVCKYTHTYVYVNKQYFCISYFGPSFLLSLWPNSGFMKYVNYERMYWNMTPWNVVDTYQRSRKTSCLPHHDRLQSQVNLKRQSISARVHGVISQRTSNRDNLKSQLANM